jgi:hypothetical protein
LTDDAEYRRQYGLLAILDVLIPAIDAAAMNCCAEENQVRHMSRSHGMTLARRKMGIILPDTDDDERLCLDQRFRTSLALFKRPLVAYVLAAAVSRDY